MKRTMIVLLAAVLFVALFALPSTPAQAQSAFCITDPGSGPVGTVFVIACSGFTPNTMLYPYAVEPDGAATIGEIRGLFPTKTDKAGNATFYFPTLYGNMIAVSLGTWHVVVEELAPGGGKLHSVDNRLKVTGDPARTVGGAMLVGLQDTVVKGHWAEFLGFGFAPNERVDVWFEFPNGDCSTVTVNFMDKIGNGGFFGGIDNGYFGSLKADKTGAIDFLVSFGFPDCEGTYRVAAKGFSSHAGAFAWINVTGSAPTESALLLASKSSVFALGDTITFAGMLFLPGEHVTCWNTSPQGQTFPVLQGFAPGLKADASGSFAFTISTGGPGGIFGFYWFSQGALGEWTMTCRGDTSKLTGLATYNVVGTEMTP